MGKIQQVVTTDKKKKINKTIFVGFAVSIHVFLMISKYESCLKKKKNVEIK